MPAEHLPFPATIQADHVIAVNGSPDRNCRGSQTLGFRRRFAELFECLMDNRNQRSQLIRWNLVVAEIRADDLSREVAIQSGFVVAGHLSSLLAVSDGLLRPSPAVNKWFLATYTNLIRE
jgi:hypothetical protein